MYKTKTAKTKDKAHTKSEDILREEHLQQVKQLYREVDKKAEIVIKAEQGKQPAEILQSTDSDLVISRRRNSDSSSKSDSTTEDESSDSSVSSASSSLIHSSRFWQTMEGLLSHSSASISEEEDSLTTSSKQLKNH